MLFALYPQKSMTMAIWKDRVQAVRLLARPAVLCSLCAGHALTIIKLWDCRVFRGVLALSQQRYAMPEQALGQCVHFQACDDSVVYPGNRFMHFSGNPGRDPFHADRMESCSGCRKGVCKMGVLHLVVASCCGHHVSVHSLLDIHCLALPSVLPGRRRSLRASRLLHAAVDPLARK